MNSRISGKWEAPWSPWEAGIIWICEWFEMKKLLFLQCLLHWLLLLFQHSLVWSFLSLQRHIWDWTHISLSQRPWFISWESYESLQFWIGLFVLYGAWINVSCSDLPFVWILNASCTLKTTSDTLSPIVLHKKLCLRSEKIIVSKEDNSSCYFKKGKQLRVKLNGKWLERNL